MDKPDFCRQKLLASNLIFLVLLLAMLAPVSANQTPLGQELAKTVNEDKKVTIALSGKSPLKKKLTYSIFQQPQHASITLKGNKAYYTPQANYFGLDEFKYQVSDGTLTSLPVTVKLTINPVNDIPVALPQAAIVSKGVSTTIVLTARDDDGDPLTYQIASKPKQGNVTINGNLATYTPKKADFQGKDRFSFKVKDGKKTSKVSPVDLEVKTIIEVGYFYDSPVQGMTYRTCNQAKTDCIDGVTGPEGQFNYRRGDNVSFSIGNISIGEITGQALVTPYNITTETFKSDKIIQLLHTLDNDQDASNGITLDSQINELSSQSFSHGSKIEDLEINTMVSAIKPNTNIVSLENAKTHADKSKTLAKLLNMDSKLAKAISGAYLSRESGVNYDRLSESMIHRLRLQLYYDGLQSLQAAQRARILKIDEISSDREMWNNGIDMVKNYVDLALLSSDFDLNSGAAEQSIFFGKMAAQLVDQINSTVVFADSLGSSGGGHGLSPELVAGLQASTSVWYGVSNMDFAEVFNAGAAAWGTRDQTETSQKIADVISAAAGCIQASLTDKDFKGCIADQTELALKMFVDITNAYRLSSNNRVLNTFNAATTYLHAYYRSGSNPAFMKSHYGIPIGIADAADFFDDQGKLKTVYDALLDSNSIQILMLVHSGMEYYTLKEAYKHFNYNFISQPIDKELFKSIVTDYINKIGDESRAYMGLLGYLGNQSNLAVNSLTPLKDGHIINAGDNLTLKADFQIPDGYQLNSQNWFVTTSHNNPKPAINQGSNGVVSVVLPNAGVYKIGTYVELIDTKGNASLLAGTIVITATAVGQACTLPWGAVLQSGSNMLAYQSASVAFAGGCVSELRGCLDGVLSGSFQYPTCTVQANQDCTLPWGATLQHGVTTVAYQAASVTSGNSCVSELRSCSSGMLSGSYQYPACTVRVDSDGDGMPDDWETAHGLNPMVNDAADDKDGDFVGNLQEYQDNTDPADKNSFLPGSVTCTAPLVLQNNTCVNPSTPTTGKLNDTGITSCSNNSSNGLACPVASFPGQDAQSGRDVTHNDDSDGHAGFSFTKLDSNGSPLPASASQWDCVKDNVTGLIWEVKTTSGLRSMNNTYSWYEPDSSKNGGTAGTQNGGVCTGSNCDTYSFVQAVNAQGLCGASDWRMPSVNDLLTIVNNQRSSPAIDITYFPNTPTGYIWSSSPNAAGWYGAWCLDYSGSILKPTDSTSKFFVRLVRGKQ